MRSGTGTRTARHHGPVDRARNGAVARTGAGCRCRATWASTWGGGTRLSLAAMITVMLKSTYAPERIEKQMGDDGGGDLRTGCVTADPHCLRRGLRDQPGKARLHHVPGRAR